MPKKNLSNHIREALDSGLTDAGDVQAYVKKWYKQTPKKGLVYNVKRQRKLQDEEPQPFQLPEVNTSEFSRAFALAAKLQEIADEYGKESLEEATNFILKK